jgi:hypothetical protein
MTISQNMEADLRQKFQPEFHDLDKVKAELADIQKRLQAMIPYAGWDKHFGLHTGQSFSRQFNLDIGAAIDNCGDAVKTIEHFWERGDD